MQYWQRLFARLSSWGIVPTLVCMSLNTSPVYSDTDPRQILDENVLMSADSISYDEKFGIIMARGNVEVSRGENVLLADRISYNRREDIVIASGNVAFLGDEGNVVFSNYMELTGDLKAGVIDEIQILFVDGSRAAALGGRMSANGRLTIDKAVYSPCRLCPNSRIKSPLWQIKSLNVVHDQSLKRIFYKDAFLEVFGLPVMYVPFFSHPDPSVKRKTGLLPPSIGSNSVLGVTYEQPFFFNLSPSKDATIAPILSSNEGVILTGEYREITQAGNYKVSGSITRADRDIEDTQETERTRGHIFAAGEFSVNSLWQAGFDVNRSTDATYLGRYSFSRDNYLGRYGFGRGYSHLTSQAYLSGANGRNFADIRALSFQSLDPNLNRSVVPYVTPLARYSYKSNPNPRGDYWLMDANLRVLGRSQGSASRRLSVKGGWKSPHVSRRGDIYTLNLSLRGDLYNVNNVPDKLSVGASRRGTLGRILPEASFLWRYPFSRNIKQGGQIVEPIIQMIWGPNGGNSSKIPNEDSLAFEFDDINLFSASRFPGLDLYEGGVRVNYGIRGESVNGSFARNEVFIGQSYRLRADDTFEVGTGLDRNFSDFVGRIIIAPAKYLDLSHQFRLDRNNLATRRSSFGASMGTRKASLSATYTKLSDGPTTGVPTSLEQINVGLGTRPWKNWRLNLSHERDLTENGGSLLSGLALIYENECVVVNSSLNRYFTQDADLEPTTNFIVRITLVNLG